LYKGINMKDITIKIEKMILNYRWPFWLLFYMIVSILFDQTIAKANSPEEPLPKGAANILSLYYFNGNVHFIVETPEYIVNDHGEIVGGKIRLSITRKNKEEEKVLYDCYEFSESDTCDIYQSTSTETRKFILDIVDPCVEKGKYLYVVAQYDENCNIIRWDNGLAKQGAEVTVPTYKGECETSIPYTSQECRYNYKQSIGKEDDDSCGCSSLSTGDPAGILTATMLLFAFFALAFERIRRRK